jgi:hypothetical protein
MSFPFETDPGGDWLGLTFYMDKMFYTPKIGFTGKAASFPFLAEMSFYPYYGCTAGMTFPLADM